MTDLRREPFRLLFPIGAMLALAGVVPWLAFGLGWSRMWPGRYHALTMTQGFLVAIAAGFLGTMIPRRTSTAPLSTAELAALAMGLGLLPVALYLDHLAIAECAYLVVLVTLVQFALRRMRHAARAAPPVPPSFVLIPCALASGAAGALLLLASAFGAAPWTAELGRSLAQEGVLLPLVLALAPMLTPILLDGEAAPPTGRRSLQAALGALFVASFGLQLVSPRLALALRGAVAAFQIGVVADVMRRPRVPGLHRRFYQLAMLVVPAGLLFAAAALPYRVPLLHLTYIGGLSLLVFSVGAHVTFLHTGHDQLARRRPWQLALVALLTLGAAAARVSAERLWSAHYVAALTTAALLWLAATATWAAYLAPMLLKRRA